MHGIYREGVDRIDSLINYNVITHERLLHAANDVSTLTLH